MALRHRNALNILTGATPTAIIAALAHATDELYNEMSPLSSIERVQRDAAVRLMVRELAEQCNTKAMDIEPALSVALEKECRQEALK